jgi:hypothetical protein
VCCEPLLSSTILFLPVVGVSDHARIHGETLLSAHPCGSDSTINGTFSESYIAKKNVSDMVSLSLEVYRARSCNWYSAESGRHEMTV